MENRRIIPLIKNSWFKVWERSRRTYIDSEKNKLTEPITIDFDNERGAEIQQKHKYSQSSNSKMFKRGWGNFQLILLFPIEEIKDGRREGVLRF